MTEGITKGNMPYQTASFGVLHPPDELPKPHIYSDIEAEKKYNEMQHDLYINSKKAHKPKKKFPAILKILGGILLVAGSCAILHKPVVKLYNKVLKKKAA